MAHSYGKYADFEGLREQAVALRRAGLSRRQIRDRLHVDNNDILNRLLEGEPAPEWTKRPNAKDDLRARARELRLEGWTYDQIQVELGCSKSSISLWVRDLPKPERRDPTEQAKLAARKRWGHELAVRDKERQRTKEAAKQAVGKLSPRELFLVGVSLYWAEGGKDKPYDRRENVAFVNSDPGMIQVFLAWLDLLGVERERLRYTVMIHENADVAGAEQYWADLVGDDSSVFNKTTLKKHNPKTVRKNVGDNYRGCLVIKVLKGADLYRRIEGSWCGIVGGATAAD
ncbi:helix-turn-helix domain-containing protein [Streptomyces blattellae]|uniref:helix-turn-helix domain-containing protein n=1 Tax=Streptomyces blattellae TaxID=2569855 RepID=UPI0012B9165F|nr:helix-turn-helix domain-containing protein [Streptomyces blattellae]